MQRHLKDPIQLMDNIHSLLTFLTSETVDIHAAVTVLISTVFFRLETSFKQANKFIFDRLQYKLTKY